MEAGEECLTRKETENLVLPTGRPHRLLSNPPPRGSYLSVDLKTNPPVGWSMNPKVAAEVNKLD